MKVHMEERKITLTEIMNGPWKERAIATCEERGIVSLADGLKPVHRFLLYQGRKMCRGKWDKVAAVGSSVAAAGYEHGEASACGALTGLGAYFSNNLQLFLGKGSFGNVLNSTPAAPRYIFCALNPNIDLLFKDADLAPEHPDPECLPPRHYLPIIPMCLVNGSTGLATGYASRIPPHDPASIIDWCISRCRGRKPKPIKPKYYGFTGEVERKSDHYLLRGTVQKVSEVHYRVTELPHGFWSSASYEQHLRKLSEKGTISRYDNGSVDDRFVYDIWLKPGCRWTQEDLVKHLKLESKDTWNLTVVSPSGRLKAYPKETGIEEMLEDFYAFRLPYYGQRIENEIRRVEAEILYRKAWIAFCEDVIAKKFSFRITDEEFEKTLKTKYKMPETGIPKTMNAPVRSFTVKAMEKSKQELQAAEERLEHLKQTTPEQEWISDLEELKKSVKAGFGAKKQGE